MKLYKGGGVAELACPKAGEGDHRTVTFVWQDGSEHADHHDLELTCECGQRLVHVGGTDPWAHPWVEVEGVPHNSRRVEVD